MTKYIEIALYLIVLLWSYVQVNVDKIQTIDDSDSLKNVSELITSKGYPVEEYSVKTEDGYILGIQRIPSRYPTKDTKVVLVQHGLLAASDSWVLNFPNQSLGFILSDAGYDVWLGNFRGNTYSKKHKYLQPTQKEFWDFSWDDMAFKDLPATIDFILKETGKQKIHYVGHSMGTSTIFALLSTYTQYNEKIESVMALAPVGNTTHVNSPQDHILVLVDKEIEIILNFLGIYDILPDNNLVFKYLADVVCTKTDLKRVCDSVVHLLLGDEGNQLNRTRIPVYFHHFPAGTSIRTIVQYSQNIKAKQFQRFDYGKEENLKRYGQDTPPAFEIEKITSPVALFWSKGDNLANPTDVFDLKERITNLIDFYKVPLLKWTHLDFVMALQSKKYLYDHLLKLLESI